MLSIDLFKQLTENKRCPITQMIPFHPVMLDSFIFDQYALLNYSEYTHNAQSELKHPVTRTPITQHEINTAISEKFIDCGDFEYTLFFGPYGCLERDWWVVPISPKEIFEAIFLNLSETS